MYKNSKRIIVLLLSLVLVISMIGCSKTQDTSGEEGIYEPGTYLAVAKGHNGDVKVEVKFDANSITSVKILEHEETEGIASTPIERIPEEIVNGQTLNVDTVTGATFTSNAILQAVEDAVLQAGGDLESLKAAADKDVDEKDEIEMTTDVVVVGAGGTGLAAAASAHENGAKVIVLEKLPMVGGSTGLSGGSISAPGTRFQQELGIEDSKESWLELWRERQASDRDTKFPDYDKVDKFIDGSVITTHWLNDYIGLEFKSVDGFGFDPAKRLHTPENGGAGIIVSLDQFLEKEGVKVLMETPATELLIDDEGNVVGVIAEGPEGKIRIHAKKVILASGGFAKNEELLARLVPEMKGTAELSVAAAGSMGDGILMAESVGAALYDENWVIGLGYTSLVPELRMLDWDSTKILVNEKGNRFMNESSHYAIVSNSVAEQDQPWLLLDSGENNAAVIEVIKGKMPNENIVEGETIEELAKAMGVDPSNLVASLKSFNEGVKSGNDEFGKPTAMLVSVEEGPFYAFKIIHRTMGTFAGVKTDDKFRVLREDGSIINNLYAGGECTNKPLYDRVYMTGSSVQFALTSGRIAGEDAAKSLD